MKYRYWCISLTVLLLVSACVSKMDNKNLNKHDDRVTIHILPNQTYVVDDNLSITVLWIVEEWLPPDRKSRMLITLRMNLNMIEEDINIDSDNPIMTWKEYNIEYLGGWRDEVQLKVSIENQ